MSFSSQLREKLAGKLSEKELGLLPSSYLMLGKILLFKLKPGLLSQRKLIGKATLELMPYLDSVFLQKGISERERKPKIELLAGKRCGEALHNENGCSFLLDVRKVMWSKGNKAEKMRLVSLAKRGETVVDMFAGIGYWTVLLAKNTKVRKIYAIDINPAAIKYLEMNVSLNKLGAKVEVLKGDCRKFAPVLEGAADRVIMGYLWGTNKFLPAALRMAKHGATIHYHCILKEGAKAPKIKSAKLVRMKMIKDYSPGMCHYVLDLEKK